MFLPFVLPGRLQNLRKRFFYWRAVYWYRFALQNDLLNRKPLHRWGRFIIAGTVVKTFQKGARSSREEELHDYNARKDNVAAHVNAFWDEELALHTADPRVAESYVHSERMFEWKHRGAQAPVSNKKDQIELARRAYGPAFLSTLTPEKQTRVREHFARIESMAATGAPAPTQLQ